MDQFCNGRLRMIAQQSNTVPTSLSQAQPNSTRELSLALSVALSEKVSLRTAFVDSIIFALVVTATWHPSTSARRSLAASAALVLGKTPSGTTCGNSTLRHLFDLSGTSVIWAPTAVRATSMHQKHKPARVRWSARLLGHGLGLT